MATAVAQLGYSRLIDVINSYTSLDAKGVYLEFAKVLHRKCPLIDILPMVPSNMIMSHIASRESYIPSPGSRRFNEYIAPTAAHTTPLTEGIAMFEDYSKVDQALWKIQNNGDQWRADRDLLHVEGFRQKIETGLFYGATAADGNDILGLAGRFALSSTYPNNDTTWKPNVWLNGGSGSTCTSIWIIEFGPHKVYAVYPKNLPAGLDIRNLGEVTSYDTSANQMQALLTHFRWCIGLVVEDERCVQRIANIATTGSANIFDETVLIQAKNRLPDGGNAPGTAILANRTITTQMDIRATVTKTNAWYTQDAAGDIFGRRVTRFQGVPVLEAEMLLDTETAVA